MKIPNLSIPISLLFVNSLAYASATHLKREEAPTVAFPQIKSGLLEINNKLTTCELGVIDSKASFVSASCLIFTDNNRVDMKQKYRVFLDATNNNNETGKITIYNVEKINVNPNYKQPSMANNIAVLEYNTKGSKDQDIKQEFAIDSNNKNWEDILYVQHKVSVDTGKWGNPRTVSLFEKPEKSCDISDLYTSNNADFLCQRAITESPNSSSGCMVSFGIAYAIINKSAYPAGLYSHSVLAKGSNICSFDPKSNYFIKFGNYLRFAQSMINRNISVIGSSQGNTEFFSGNSKYTMDTKSNDVSDGHVDYVSGDFLKAQFGIEPDYDDGGNLSNKAIAIIAGCSSAAAVAIFILVWVLLARRYRRHKNNAKWDPHAQEISLQTMVNEIGGAEMTRGVDTPPYFMEDERPPSYRSMYDLDDLRDVEVSSQQSLHPSRYR